MEPETLYIVTDIEADGIYPGRNSMMAFASVAVSLPFRVHGQFEAVLTPLDDCAADPATMAWFATQPKALAAAQHNPKPADQVMAAYVDWLRALNGRRLFAAHGLAFDGGWIDHYLARFTPYRLIADPRDPDPLFFQGGLCLRSLAAGVLNWPYESCIPANYPQAMIGQVPHTHRAIDDVLGFAHLLAHLMPGADRSGPP